MLEEMTARSITRAWQSSYNHVFANMIYTMLGRDQAIRARMEELYGNDSSKKVEGFRIQAFLDTAVNMPDLIGYLKKNGFPTSREMDDEVRGHLQLIIHHLIAGYEGQSTIELHKIVQEAIYEGKYSPYAYMLALDWGAINRTGKQIYGTYIGPDPNGTMTFYPPIADISSVDTRRAKWKQGPLRDVPLSDWRKPKLPTGYLSP